MVGRTHTPQSMPTDSERESGEFPTGRSLVLWFSHACCGHQQVAEFPSSIPFRVPVCLRVCVCVSAARVVSFCSYCNLVQLYAAYLIYILTRTHTHTRTLSRSAFTIEFLKSLSLLTHVKHASLSLPLSLSLSLLLCRQSAVNQLEIEKFN